MRDATRSAPSGRLAHAMSLPTYAAKRGLAALVVILGVVVGTFVGLHVLRPDAFTDTRPLPVELASYLERALLHGDLGVSAAPRNPEVVDLIAEGLPVDIALLAGALATGVLLGVTAGVIAASRPGSLAARAVEILAALGLVAPVYWVGLTAALLFAPGLGAPLPLPLFSEPGSYQPLTQAPGAWLESLLVPWLVLALPTAALCARMMGSSMREVLGNDYVRTARAKGLRERTVLRRHAVPAAAAPVATVVGIYMATVASNALLVEEVFGIPGALRMTLRATVTGDFLLLQGLVIVTTTLVVIGTFAADLVAAWLDPRTREKI